jgi:hypothetical protein
MIPTTNKIIQLSPYGLQQAITILLTLNLTIYHIAQVLHMHTEWVSSIKTATLAIQDLKGRISSKFADQFIF